ncbi:NUDIX domain-containing protein [Streptococcus zalophi]|uniref:NUDIX domain-containing protein n=1 Tax=Streptococcus zalophi TaxID=640031 RepID=UPI001FE4DC85|nr:NUDIX domain-containing protein [Streptococcus zalophi]
MIDTRVFITDGQKILLARDVVSGEWSLPGGFLEIGLILKENILKEVLEETGYKERVERLLAVFDANKHQLQAKQYLKLVYLCHLEDGHFIPNHEVSKMSYFDITNLPVLSIKRTSEKQLEILCDIVENKRDCYSD